jgi:apolipoprotein D and lipocalin family protein
LLSSCTGIPEGITPVNNFDVQRYLGTWYEIARLDHSFERGLEQVTANYSLNSDRSITVVNQGFDPEREQWKSATGKAKFVGQSDTGHLKVSFFGPFYGSYVIFHLEKDNYSHALVAGPSRKYFWILSRTPTLPTQQLETLVAIAKKNGFATDQLIYPDPAIPAQN